MANLELRGTVEKKLENEQEIGTDGRTVGLKGASYRKTRAQRNAQLRANNKNNKTTGELNR